MSRSNDLYKMYEEEYNKRVALVKENKNLKLTNAILKRDLNDAIASNNNKIQKEVERAIAPLIKENTMIKENYSKALQEIERLKEQLHIQNLKEDKDYAIDKLKNQVSKDSTNSSIPTSKELIRKNKKTGANTYSHRVSTGKTTGGQKGHKGKTLLKEKVEEEIRTGKVKTVKEVKHFIKCKKNQNAIVKYRVGIEIKKYVEKHIFIPAPDAKEKLPKEFYSDVTYDDSIRMLVILLGNYCSLPYNKIVELISDLTDNVINLSQGTVDNIYTEFSNKLDDTVNNITTNLMNGTYQHTDETTTKENGKEVYYRGYANAENVLYKYHHHKGDVPIEEDGILTSFFGTIISDHDKGIFKYGTNNQDCVIHFGRYCIEEDQNVDYIYWPMDLYRLLLKFDRNRKILEGLGASEFCESDIKFMEDEYDSILQRAEIENNDIKSTYWKEKTDTLLKRCKKYKSSMLFYIHDFTVPCENNFMERALRMIKSKTKVSGGFRSKLGGIRFGRIMSVIKTAKLRSMNPFDAIKTIMQGQALFA